MAAKEGARSHGKERIKAQEELNTTAMTLSSLLFRRRDPHLEGRGKRRGDFCRKDHIPAAQAPCDEKCPAPAAAVRTQHNSPWQYAEKGKKRGRGATAGKAGGKKKNASSFPYKVDEGTSDGRYELLNLITLSLLCFYKKQKLLLEETVNKTEALKSKTTD